jgi:hypothetical protein
MENLTMKLGTRGEVKLPLQDYSQAFSKAITWLGERYVLASPQKPTRRHQAPPDFLQASDQRDML